MAVANVRVVASNTTRDDRDRSFKYLFKTFKRAVGAAGVLKEYKRHEFYESPSRKKRRKKRESLINALRAKMRESFPYNNKDKSKLKEREVE